MEVKTGAQCRSIVLLEHCPTRRWEQDREVTFSMLFYDSPLLFQEAGKSCCHKAVLESPTGDSQMNGGNYYSGAGRRAKRSRAGVSREQRDDTAELL